MGEVERIEVVQKSFSLGVDSDASPFHQDEITLDEHLESNP